MIKWAHSCLRSKERVQHLQQTTPAGGTTATTYYRRDHGAVEDGEGQGQGQADA